MSYESYETSPSTRAPLPCRAMAPKGATTPYFAFMNANRAAVKAALVEAGAPAAMGDIGKELGARWRALSDDEKKARADAGLLRRCKAA